MVSSNFSGAWLNNQDDILAIVPGWMELWRRVGRNPFSFPFWVVNWFTTLCPGEPRVLVIREGIDIVGVLPFFEANSTLHIAGLGISDYLDVLIDHHVFHLIWAMVGTFFRGRTVVLTDLPATSPFISVSPPKEWAIKATPYRPCPFLALPGTSTRLRDVIPNRMAANLRNCYSKAERSGGIRIEHPLDNNIDEFIDFFIYIHSLRWRKDDKPGALAAQNVQKFHRLSIPEMLKNDILRMEILSIGAKRVAAYYGFHVADTSYYYLSGFDPEESRASPGSLVVASAIENSLMENDTKFDFLRGGEKYKYKWGATDSYSWHIMIKIL